MSFERFIELLQMLITMTDQSNKEEVLNAETILKNLYELARSSEMADAQTLRTMRTAFLQYGLLLRRKEDFAGRPGDFDGNRAKRNRLAMMIRPGC